eukprot:2240250-Pleurochrysis_carterae.AAC.4
MQSIKASAAGGWDAPCLRQPSPTGQTMGPDRRRGRARCNPRERRSTPGCRAGVATCGTRTACACCWRPGRRCRCRGCAAEERGDAAM